MKPLNERLAEAQGYVAACKARCDLTKTPEGQKYPSGTRVHIAADLGPGMSHFTSDVDGTVCYSYKQMFGGDARQAKEYCIDIDGRGTSSWYKEHQLTPI